MSAITTSSRILLRVKHVWQELDYAQRKLFEVQTGVPVTERRSRRPSQIDELASLYRHPARF
jgi:hypothetical protein